MKWFKTFDGLKDILKQARQRQRIKIEKEESEKDRLIKEFEPLLHKVCVKFSKSISGNIRRRGKTSPVPLSPDYYSKYIEDLRENGKLSRSYSSEGICFEINYPLIGNVGCTVIIYLVLDLSAPRIEVWHKGDTSPDRLVSTMPINEFNEEGLAKVLSDDFRNFVTIASQ